MERPKDPWWERRIVACLTACQGLSSAELESGLVPAPNYIRARDQRDELRAKNEQLVGMLHKFIFLAKEPTGMDWSLVIEEARNVITENEVNV